MNSVEILLSFIWHCLFGICLFLPLPSPAQTQVEAKGETASSSPDSIRYSISEGNIRINDEAVKLIQFDFLSGNESEKKELLEAPLEKKWMKFKEDFSLPRSFTDTAKVKKIEGYVRAEPYTIWTKFGENPVYDVLPNVEKKWEIQWTLNPFGGLNEEYGRSLKPSPGKMYQQVSTPLGSSIILIVDFDKILYENLTKRGRAIKHNRKYANAWKSYKDYQPTAADSAKFPNFYRKSTEEFAPVPLLPVYHRSSCQLPNDSVDNKNDSICNTSGLANIKKDSVRLPHTPDLRHQNDSPGDEDDLPENESRFERYIRLQQRKDKVQRELNKRKNKGVKNAYDIGKEIRIIREQQN